MPERASPQISPFRIDPFGLGRLDEIRSAAETPWPLEIGFLQIEVLAFPKPYGRSAMRHGMDSRNDMRPHADEHSLLQHLFSFFVY